jgi:hypothetical protein
MSEKELLAAFDAGLSRLSDAIDKQNRIIEHGQKLNNTRPLQKISSS